MCPAAEQLPQRRRMVLTLQEGTRCSQGMPGTSASRRAANTSKASARNQASSSRRTRSGSAPRLLTTSRPPSKRTPSQDREASTSRRQGCPRYQCVAPLQYAGGAGVSCRRCRRSRIQAPRRRTASPAADSGAPGGSTASTNPSGLIRISRRVRRSVPKRIA